MGSGGAAPQGPPEAGPARELAAGTAAAAAPAGGRAAIDCNEAPASDSAEDTELLGGEGGGGQGSMMDLGDEEDEELQMALALSVSEVQ